MSELIIQIRKARKIDLEEIGAKYKISVCVRDGKKVLYKKLIEELIENEILPTSGLLEIPKEATSHAVELQRLEI